MTTTTPTIQSVPTTPVDPPRAEVRAWAVPPVDVLEKDGDLRLRLDVPGVTPDGLEIEVREGALSISGQRAEQPERGWRRVFRLPDTVDASAIRATLKHGVLTLDLPRAEAAKPRRVTVTTG